MSIYEQVPFPEQDLFLCYLPSHLEGIIYHNIRLWSWTMYIYIWLKFTHCTMAIVSVGLIGKGYLGTAGEPWMYPPIFGPAGSFLTTWKVQGK
jgi:hypothetical protein